MEYVEKKFLYYTECQLATLEYHKRRKSVSKSETERHEKIAQGMVEVCRDIRPDSFELMKLPRLKELLLSPADRGYNPANA